MNALYQFKNLNFLTHLQFIAPIPNADIRTVSFDSRIIIDYKNTLFVAIKTENRDGHLFIKELIKKGCLNFIISNKKYIQEFKLINFILVPNSVDALQQLAINYRNRFNLKTIAITGSNGKTICKEWLAQCMNLKFNIVKTPQSFNSQIGVPISVFNIRTQHNLGIFEAGISKPNEMQKLEPIIKPNIGILTNVGDAHQEGFKNKKQKIAEKLLLFKNANCLLFFDKDIENKNIILNINPSIILLNIGTDETSVFCIKTIYKTNKKTEIQIVYKKKTHHFILSFLDDASVQNTLICICLLCYLNFSAHDIQEAILHLSNIPMRLEISKGLHHCTLINDSYSNDMTSLKIAIEFLKNRKDHTHKTIFLSNFVNKENEYDTVVQLINNLQPYKIIFIGSKLMALKNQFPKIKHQYFFKNTIAFLKQSQHISFKNELILFKGSRIFKFEDIIYQLKSNVHESILEINLNNLIHNYNQFLTILNPQTKIMAVIKASAYGSGSIEVAKALQHKKVDYFAVAYINEGIELRDNNIDTPIMVMNVNEKNFLHLVQYNLEPEIYSQELLNQLLTFLQSHNILNFSIHIKIDTGMNRVGFKKDQITYLISTLKQNKIYFKIKSVFSHLVGSDDKKFNAFSKKQFEEFIHITKQLEQHHFKFLKHIANTGDDTNHLDMQLNMVRLGIGLYGIENGALIKNKLKPVLTFKTSITQIKTLNPNDTVSYNRTGKSKNKKPYVVATLRTGYAEGYPRILGNSNANVLINNKLAPTIGNICMDMMMVDISHLENVNVGDTVILFGEKPSIEEVAKQALTIPYEIMTGISQRVRKEYVYD